MNLNFGIWFITKEIYFKKLMGGYLPLPSALFLFWGVEFYIFFKA